MTSRTSSLTPPFIACVVTVTLPIFRPHHNHVGPDPVRPRHAAIFTSSVTVRRLFVFTQPGACRISSLIHVK